MSNRTKDLVDIKDLPFDTSYLKGLTIVYPSISLIGSQCKICGKKFRDDDKHSQIHLSHMGGIYPIIDHCHNEYCTKSAHASADIYYAIHNIFATSEPIPDTYTVHRSDGAVETNWKITYGTFFNTSSCKPEYEKYLKFYAFRMEGPLEAVKTIPIELFVEWNPNVNLMSLYPNLSEYYPKELKDKIKASFEKFGKA